VAARTPSTAPAATPPGLDALLASKEMIIVCGSGGTGKTTVAAALGAIAATRLGARVLVLTIDPARRLATALGLGPLGNTEVQVDPAVLLAADSGAGGSGRRHGELWVAMLDTKSGWDELVRRHAPDAAVREQVLANPLYKNVTGRFVHSHDYIAMERLHELHASGRFDLLVIDTPPSRNALDLLDAPGRMKEFFASRLLRWLTVPYRSRFFTLASKPFYQVADRILGSRFLQDIAEFFVLFQTMEKGFVKRANEVEQLLVDPRTSFVVVSTLEAAPAYEALHLARELEARSMHLGAVVLNRVLPAAIRQPAAAKAARRLRVAVDDQSFIERTAQAADAPTDVVRDVLVEVSERFHDVAVVAHREAERRGELERLGAITASAPNLAGEVTDLDALCVLGAHLIGRGRGAKA
jgi:anion-transporting  ArsA/GET3 family ATPase